MASASWTLFLNPLIALPKPSPNCGIFPAPKMINTMIKISSSSIHPNEPNIWKILFFLRSVPSRLNPEGPVLPNTKGGGSSSNGGEAIQIREISQV